MQVGDFYSASVNGRRMLVQIAKIDGDYVSAWRVTKTGEKFERETKNTVEQFLMIGLQRHTLRKKMIMNLHYGELVATETEQ